MKPEITEFDPVLHAAHLAAPCSITLSNAQWDRVWEILCKERDSYPDPTSDDVLPLNDIICTLEAAS